MATSIGRPGISYAAFVKVWQQLLEEGRAANNLAQKLLGGSYSTIAKFHETYEKQQLSKQRDLLNSIELPEALLHALAEIKVKDIAALEQSLKQSEARCNEHLGRIEALEKKLAASKVMLDEQKVNFELEILSLERSLAGAQALTAEGKQQEHQLIAKYEKLHKQYMQSKQEAAVVRKEVEILREAKKI